jgi:hypothetical protein
MKHNKAECRLHNEAGLIFLKVSDHGLSLCQDAAAGGQAREWLAWRAEGLGRVRVRLGQVA